MKPVFIIAEAGLNHIGSPDLAQKRIDAALDSGANVVKFQTYSEENLVSPSAKKAGFQIRNIGNDESQYEMLKKLELSRDVHRELLDYCVTN